MYASYYPFVPGMAFVLMLVAFLLPTRSDKVPERLALSISSAILYIAAYFLAHNLTAYEGAVSYTFDVTALKALWIGLFFVMVLYSVYSIAIAGVATAPIDERQERYEEFEGGLP